LPKLFDLSSDAYGNVKIFTKRSRKFAMNTYGMNYRGQSGIKAIDNRDIICQNDVYADFSRQDAWKSATNKGGKIV
jgi:hypothetical protein